MPRKAASKLSKGYSYASSGDEFETLLGNSPGVALPAVPIANSWNYGAQTTSALPTQTPVDPNISPAHIAKKIEAGIQIAQRRDSPSQQRRNPERRTRRKREPTPDQAQLQQDLDGFASPTPSPPVRNSVSTDSSSGEEPPRQRRLSVMSNEPLSSPDRESSVDNVSELSWDLERDIHGDDLQRTRPSKYRGERHGKNITKPPRRPSGLGLAMTQETIEEEEEPSSEEEDAAESDAGKDDEEDKKAEAVEEVAVEQEAEPVTSSWTAPVRTIIPSMFRRSQSAEAGFEMNSPQPPKDSLSRQWFPSIRPTSRDGQPHTSMPKPNRTNWIRAGLILLLSLALAFALQGGLWAALPHDKMSKLRWPIPFRQPRINLPPNITESEIFHGFTDQVSKMNSQMSSMSRELSSVLAENANAPRPTDIHVPVVVGPRHPPRINFLSPAMGAIVDPANTAPTASENHPSYFKRVVMRMFRLGANFGRGPLPPVAALSPWEETGDCWCSTPREGVTQLAVLLGRDIVPEEVIVEHVPAGTTLHPDSAPKEIEMWARFRVIPLDQEDNNNTEQSWWPWSSKKKIRSAEPPSAREAGLGGYNIPGEKSLHDVLMSSLRISNAFEPESSYSDDPVLGANFYRIGKMEYDIHRENNIQRFALNAIVDIPTVRVDKVVFRVKSNWGSDITCIYRIRLHGHL
ncbi:uncharacterized protein N7477_003739 [Penicillium maclennaniae]|uniref:uncharacterized protein n=1 Tax=Penicillium maclennaniae TaxID=1343394 RepID=UPI002540A08D|nr:uncharacterized protein N7477_003739 [Penicillium maclennaniae]KAJ5678106.1 hypothetical protein N7477_003739 [Penicillium maclennaniae]